MASSPLSTPGTPRTSSPLLSEDDTSRARSPSLDDAPPMAIQHDVETVPRRSMAASAVTALAAGEAGHAAAKGKEKAARGPLRLLDLPVDVLKEIIHQVYMALGVASSIALQACSAHAAPGQANIGNHAAPSHQRPHFAVALPLGAAPAHDPMHLLALRHRVARREHPHGTALGRRCAHVRPRDIGHGRRLLPAPDSPCGARTHVACSNQVSCDSLSHPAAPLWQLLRPVHQEVLSGQRPAGMGAGVHDHQRGW